MTFLDARGRLFGRFNLVDVAVAAFLIVVIPMAYGVVRLFRPSTPHIESVSQVPFGKEERRIAAGAVVSAKLKLKGSGFSPMLRVTIGDTQALAFVFETPNSADVVVGTLPPGRHDLVLFDGVQEVARAPGAVTIAAEQWTSSVRLEGWLTGLDPQVSETLRAGLTLPEGAGLFTIIALGTARPAATRVPLPEGAVDLPREGRLDRRILIEARCNDDPCSIGGQPVASATATREGESAERSIMLPGPSRALQLTVTDVFPAARPRPARVQVRLTGGAELARVAVGDRDDLLDPRAAVVTAAQPVETAGGERLRLVTVTLGLDDSREGWRYRGRVVTPGRRIVLDTDRYHVGGVVQAVELLTAESSR